MVNFSKAAFVNKFPHTLQVGITPGDVGFTDTKHVNSGFVKLNKDAIVNLLQPEELENLAHLGGDFVHTETSSNEIITLSWDSLIQDNKS